ncbi:DUF4097 family beta strand repeat-containing protein [Kitasatospora sp. NPDC051853]|uniref:DUF4097 family beta strand repeat-containing protein n=1 Tax=Kitasatospora sp. NPDC051853 TaxID=3364058 RepID=UPI00379578A2
MNTFTTTLNIASGRIRIIATDRTDATVRVLPADPGSSRDVKAAEQTVVEQQDGTLRIHTPESAKRAFGPSGSVEVTVQLPTGSRVLAELADGELHSTGQLGEVTFTGANGTVGLDGTTTTRITLQAGDIRLGALAGDAELTTAKGDITVTTAPGTSAVLDASTAYGRVVNALRNDGAPAVTVRASTSYGDVTARSL